MRPQRQRGGVTLLETVIVLGIVALLLAFTLPAIQKVRETANRMACASRLRQLGLALHLHHQDYGVLPSNGGWDGQQQIKDVYGNLFTPATTDYLQGKTWQWGVGQPGLAPREQTGSWLYAILPYLEKAAQHQDRDWTQPYELFHCPSRRRAQSWLVQNDQYGAYQAGGWNWAKTDYAANGYVVANRPRCMSFAEITDGLSNTILLGEKALNSQDALRETWYWDEPFFIGGSGGTQRFGSFVLTDSLSRFPWFLDAWGSAHQGTMQGLNADCSIRALKTLRGPRSILPLLTPASSDLASDEPL